jgi:Cu2+-exporting ATPase
VTQNVGIGVAAELAGHDYEIGNVSLAEQYSADEDFCDALQQMIDDRVSPVIVIRDQRCVAAFGLKDSIRAEANGVVTDLRSRGWGVQIISGDHEMTVQHVANQLGLEEQNAHGNLLPEDKLAAIREAEKSGPVIMVGDGVNDAAALAAADVGIAVRGGAIASLAAAPVVINGRTLRGVVELLDSSIQTRRTIKRNFAISISYNAVAVVLAMTGWITPLIAAALMPASSLTVLGLTLAPNSSQDHS